MKAFRINSIYIELPNKINTIMRTLAKPVFLITHDDIAFLETNPIQRDLDSQLLDAIETEIILETDTTKNSNTPPFKTSENSVLQTGDV